MDLLVGNDAPRKRLVEAPAGRKPKPLTQQDDPFPVSARRKRRPGVDPELRQAAPLLLISNEAAAQLGIKRVDGSDEVERSARVSGEGCVIELGIAPADVAADLRRPSSNVNMVAPRVLEQGIGYLSERKYEVFADFTEGSPMLDPATVDWQAVRDGKLRLRIRRGPGPGNSMGDIKFMMPNDLGIYLHDTHDKTLFAKDDRWVSNGCVRVEDAQRLATWLFGAMPAVADVSVETRVNLREPVPVFLTYLTASATPGGVVFRADPYERDTAVLARYFGAERLLQ